MRPEGKVVQALRASAAGLSERLGYHDAGELAVAEPPRGRGAALPARAPRKRSPGPAKKVRNSG